MPRLSKDKRSIPHGCSKQAYLKPLLQRQPEKNQKTISLLWIRFQTPGFTNGLPRSGRPRVAIPTEDRQIRLLHLGNRLLTEVDNAYNAFGRRVNPKTVQNRRKCCSLKARRPIKGIELTCWHKTS